MVFNRPFVKLTIVIDWSEGSVFLLDEEEGGGIGTFRGSDVTFG